MASESYSVVFSGEIADGHDRGEVKENVAKAFKLKAAQVDKLFSGKPIAIKRGLEKAEAIKYRTLLVKAGAVGKIMVSRAEPGAKAVAVKSSGTQKTAQAAPAAKGAAQPASGIGTDSLCCPRCGHEQPVAKACGLCKMDLRLHIKRLERRERLRQNRRRQRQAAG